MHLSYPFIRSNGEETEQLEEIHLNMGEEHAHATQTELLRFELRPGHCRPKLIPSSTRYLYFGEIG